MSSGGCKYHILLVIMAGHQFFAVESGKVADLASRPRTVLELTEFWGYPTESHRITTDDGYILTMHRIPPANASAAPIVFLLHGIFGTSARWTLGPPDKSLAYILANKGFDVWMGNTRGNTYSRNHTRLNPDEAGAFWDFDLETASIGDLTASFDYIVNVTDDSSEEVPFFYICHSMGCAEILALLSELPEYNDLFDALFLMAPPVFMGRSRAALFTGIADLTAKYMGFREIRKPRPRPWWINCQNSICRTMASKMLSVSYDQLNMDMLPIIYDHLAQRSSSKVVYHFAQLMKASEGLETGFFGKYDYGLEENERRYNGSQTPPAFNLSRVDAPLYIFYGNGDKLIAVDDVKALAKTMPSTEAIYQIDYQGWNHNDFVYASAAKELVYDTIIKHMDEIIAGYANHTLLNE